MRYSQSRQKSCQACSKTKAKCDRRPTGCSRCGQRGLDCTYLSTPGSKGSRRSAQGAVGITDETTRASDTLLAPASNETAFDLEPSTQVPSPSASHWSVYGSATVVSTPTPYSSNQHQAPISKDAGLFDFTGIDLVCPISVENISSRWLNAYFPSPSQVPKEYHPRVNDFICRMLRSYADTAIRGREVPPFVHPSQLAAKSACPPLATCLSMVRVCDRPHPGSESAAVDVIQREMASVFERRADFGGISLFAAFQAYLIYAMVLFLRLDEFCSHQALHATIANLQELASLTSRDGLMCLAEQQHSRPRWEAWIAAETKRRAVYVMYLLDNVLSRREGLPTYLGTELRGLPAPAGKSLWEASTRREWEMRYNVHLVDWPAGNLQIDELWPLPPDTNEEILTERRRRVDLWLEDLDPYGVMMYSVTSHTHGV